MQKIFYSVLLCDGPFELKLEIRKLLSDLNQSKQFQHTDTVPLFFITLLHNHPKGCNKYTLSCVHNPLTGPRFHQD